MDSFGLKAVYLLVFNDFNFIFKVFINISELQIRQFAYRTIRRKTCVFALIWY